jgi:hypothetical protein
MFDTDIEAIAGRTKRYCDHFGYKCSSETTASGKRSYRLELAYEGILSYQSFINDEVQRRLFASSFKVNDEHYDLRNEKDMYGRKMTDLRRSLTKQDSQPFETT